MRSGFVSTLGTARSLDRNSLTASTAWTENAKNTLFSLEVLTILTHATDQEWKVSQLCHGLARRQTRPGKSAMAGSTSNGPVEGIWAIQDESTADGTFRYPNEFPTREERYGNVLSSALNRARASCREHCKSAPLSEELQ